MSGSLDYDRARSLCSQARSGLQWVIENITQCNGRLFQVPKVIDIYIQSVASLIGWGAVSGSLSASGRWSQSETKHHINYLELLAPFHALQCFESNSRSIHVRLAIANSTAVPCINNVEGARSPLLSRFIVQKYLGMVQVEGYFYFCSAHPRKGYYSGPYLIQGNPL